MSANCLQKALTDTVTHTLGLQHECHNIHSSDRVISVRDNMIQTAALGMDTLSAISDLIEAHRFKYKIQGSGA